MGTGLAGMAASLHLAKAGLSVVCVGPDPTGSHPVGESLDWSAPALLEAVGLPMASLIAEEIATYKRHVTLKLCDGSQQHYVPSEWLGRPPFNVELRTMHVDRTKLNAALRRIVLDHGVRIVADKIVDVQSEGRRVVAVTTASGARFASPWFIDASGSAASLLPRVFNLPAREYGPSKVAMWSYFDVQDSVEGTTLYANRQRPRYMDWIWEIPIHPKTISVGYVATGAAIKEKRRQGHSVEEIFKAQLDRHPRFAELLRAADVVVPRVTSFRCRVHGKLAGPNWLVVGEAASMVDPMTSNGVTAALRHASEASTLIVRSRRRDRLPLLARSMYSWRVGGLARFFNSGIEKVIYDWPVRNYIGVLNAGDVYTVPAWSLNALYARFSPRGVLPTMLLNAALSLLRASAAVLYSFSKYREVSCETEA
jgi:flavin-dependent dehydrogenase